MAWIESHVDLGDHPKTYALSATLDIPKAYAVGILTLLWHYTFKYAWRDGDLSKMSKAAICAAVDWRGDADTLISALQSCGWLDEMRVHDWMEYAGKLVSDRLYNEKRRRRKTALNGVKSRKTSATVPYPTVPYRTEQNQKEKDICPEPKIGLPADASPAFEIHHSVSGLTLYETDRRLLSRLPELYEAWVTAFPGVDVKAEIAKAHAWELANKERRKVDRPKFLGNWLSRQQDRAGPIPTKARFPTADERLKAELKRQEELRGIADREIQREREIDNGKRAVPALRLAGDANL